MKNLNKQTSRMKSKSSLVKMKIKAVWAKLLILLAPVISFLSPAVAVIKKALAPVIAVIKKALTPVIAVIKKISAPVIKVIKVICKPFKDAIDRVRELERKPMFFCLGLSFMLYLLVEMLSRRSPVAGIEYLVSNPTVFLYNWLIVLLTLSVALFFKKREFVFLLVSIFWTALGVVNCVLLGFRTTPLNAMDFSTFKDVMSIMTVYFTKKQIIEMAVGLVVFVAFVVFLFVKSPRVKPKISRCLASVSTIAFVLVVTTSFSVNTGILATTFHNIQDAYKDYGFAYCFACSVVDRGVSKPDYYSQQSVDAIVNKINAEGGDVTAEVTPSENATTETPNIVVLQMESFFDVNHLKDVTYSENPVPVFTKLKEDYSSGLLTTPSFGAGTSNTEFEVLTAMSLSFFGPGEYPYTTVLRNTGKTDESVCYDLKDYGYSTHAIHNHTGRFYGRNYVYPNLGFDSFTSVEYMQDIERNALNWADDSCLTTEITKAMDDTENQDFVFAVSVQGHGKYPTEEIDDTQTITATGFDENEAVGFDYYINQINRMDQFLGELTDTLSQSDEPTVLVIYGDHLPKFSFEPSDLDNNNIYQTEYVIWDNFGMQQEDRELATYQLYPQVMNLLNMHNGIMTQFHQYCENDDDFYSNLHTLQYDLLYGKCYMYGGINPFVPAEMKMGIDPISISDISAVGNYLYVKGENFTSYSKIFINGSEQKTKCTSPGRIYCMSGERLKPGDEIEVVQMSSRKTHLSSTIKWTWYPYGAVAESTEDEINNVITGTDSAEDIAADIKEEENDV